MSSGGGLVKIAGIDKKVMREVYDIEVAPDANNESLDDLVDDFNIAFNEAGIGNIIVAVRTNETISISQIEGINVEDLLAGICVFVDLCLGEMEALLVGQRVHQRHAEGGRGAEATVGPQVTRHRHLILLMYA